MNFLPALLTALFWGIAYGSCEQALKGMDKRVFLLLSSLSMAVFWFVFYFIGKESIKVNYNSFFWLLVNIVSHLLGSYFCLKAIHEMGAVRASVIEVSYPIFCSLFIMTVTLKSTINPQQFFCMLLVILGSSMFIWFGKN